MKYRAPIIDYVKNIQLDNHINDNVLHVEVDEFSPKATVDGHIADDVVHVGVDEFSPKATVDGHIADNAVHVGVDEFSPKATVDGHIADNAVHVGVDEYVRQTNLLQGAMSDILAFVGTLSTFGVRVATAGNWVEFYNILPTNLEAISAIGLIALSTGNRTNMYFNVEATAGAIGQVYNAHTLGSSLFRFDSMTANYWHYIDLRTPLNFLSAGDILRTRISYNATATATNAYFLGIRVLYTIVP